jgi:hypothetical protein
MKTKLFQSRFLIVTCCVFLLFKFQTTAQTNTREKDIEIQFTRGYGWFGDDASGNEELTWISRAVPKSIAGQTRPETVQLFNKSSGADNSPNNCYTVNTTLQNSWFSFFPGQMGYIENNLNYEFFWEVMTWEDDGAGERCRYDFGPDINDDDAVYSAAGKTAVNTNIYGWQDWGTNDNNNTTYSNTTYDNGFIFGSNKSSKFKGRYAQVLHYGKKLNEPLFFNLSTNDFGSHTYKIQNIAGADARLNHSNSLTNGNFTNGQEVYYKFSLT